MPKITEKNIKELIAQLEVKKQQLQELKGRRQALVEQLTKEYEVSTYAEAEKKQKELEEQYNNMASTVETQIKKFDEEYGDILNELLD